MYCTIYPRTKHEVLHNTFKGQTSNSAQHILEPYTKYCTTNSRATQQILYTHFRTEHKYCTIFPRTKRKVLYNKSYDHTQSTAQQIQRSDTEYCTTKLRIIHKVLNNKKKELHKVLHNTFSDHTQCSVQQIQKPNTKYCITISRTKLKVLHSKFQDQTQAQSNNGSINKQSINNNRNTTLERAAAVSTEGL